jgi:hypothetical protein
VFNCATIVVSNCACFAACRHAKTVTAVVVRLLNGMLMGQMVSNPRTVVKPKIQYFGTIDRKRVWGDNRIMLRNFTEHPVITILNHNVQVAEMEREPDPFPEDFDLDPEFCDEYAQWCGSLDEELTNQDAEDAL